MAEDKAASVGTLEGLHRLVAKSLSERIEQDLADNLPTDAATLGAAIKFLKDNQITADPADTDDLTALREKLKEQAARRKERTGKILSLVEDDIKEA